MRTLSVKDGVDAMVEAERIVKQAPLMARILVAVHRGHNTIEALTDVLGKARDNVTNAVTRMIERGLLAEDWSTAFDDIPDAMPTGKSKPARGGGGGTKGGKS